MLIALFWSVVGLASMVTGADLLVRGASRLASAFGVSKLIIGLTIVAFGTSAPELAVSILAGVGGETDIMLGNIIGSNLANILLILGVSAVLLPMHVNFRVIRFDLLLMIAITLLLFLFSFNNRIIFVESLILVFLLVLYLIFLALNPKRGALPADSEPADLSEEEGTFLRTKSALFTLCGLVLLLTGAKWLVESAVEIAQIAGVSERVIGLTIVAGGTSLPELSTAIAATFRREQDLVLSTIIGSNLYNILAVLGITSLIVIEPIPVHHSTVMIDLFFLIGVSIACIPVFLSGNRISRGEGGMFLGCYCAYVIYLWVAAGEQTILF